MNRASQRELVKTVVGILDQYRNLYRELSGGRTSDYLEYVTLGKSDEEQLVRPTLFPEFMNHVLGFSKLDYVPERPIIGQGKPDFTPTDLSLHPFIFETKGSDSSRSDLVHEYRRKSRGYLFGSEYAEYAVITNMAELVVFAKDGDRLMDEFSFSFVSLYRQYKTERSLNLEDTNVAAFLRFVRKFQRRPLTSEQKISAIARAEPHPVQEVKIETTYREFETLTQSVREVVEWLRSDVASKGSREILRVLRQSPERKRRLAMEIYAIRSEISGSREVPEEVTPEDLDELLDSRDYLTSAALDLYAYRVAYFTMARILLVRAWEDSRFIDESYHTLFDGGFAEWYFNRFDQEIAKVLIQAFQFAKEKYEWLFTDESNYAWYIPSDNTLVDILYELGKYNFSVLNRDVLGVVYEEYLDRQDKKNKGQYYTPYPIVELIWDEIGFSQNRDFYDSKGGGRTPKRVFDPATGSGGFLVEAARRIRTGTYPSRGLENLLDIKDAIVSGLHGSEISPFSYYITEINLLLQLTPVIKQIAERDRGRQDFEGRFTLSVIRQDSLGLLAPTSTITEEQGAQERNEAYYGLEVLMPSGEKRNVYERIRNTSEFDYVVANPPYIGEDGHKELFRRTLELFPYWKQHYQGKMDYLYFFIILGLSKLKEGGKLGFITTSYWLTADGASKLRSFILDNARILKIVNFHEVKLFEHAKGQHSLVFVLERTDREESRDKNRIQLVEIKKQMEADTVNDRIRLLCRHIRDKSGQASYNDEYISSYQAPFHQGELTAEAWYLFQTESVNELLNRVEEMGERLDFICDVHQGLISRAHKVNKSVLEHLSPKKIEEGAIESGDGLFVLSKDEVDALGLSEDESSILRPFYKNSDIKRYVVPLSQPKEFVIYTTKDTKIRDFPTIERHLEKFRTALATKRDAYGEKYPWFKLHREREERVFEGEKIVCPYRSPLNTFAYTKRPFYGSTDMYFITHKESQRLDYPSLDLHYVLGVLNSNVMRLWTYHRTKAKGKVRELFYTPLRKFPVRMIDFDDQAEVQRYRQIVETVRRIVGLKSELFEFDSLFEPRLSDLFEGSELPPMDETKVVEHLPDGKLRMVSRAKSLEIEEYPTEFQLKAVGEIKPSESRGSSLSHEMSLLGADGTVVPIRGDRTLLRYLKSVLVGKRGATFEEIARISIPVDASTLQARTEEIRREVVDLWNEVTELQATIDELVCELYDLEKPIVDQMIREEENSD